MSRPSDQLDDFVEALNTGTSTPSAVDDEELQGLLETAQLVHAVAGREWPDRDFGARLAVSLSSQLRPNSVPVTTNGVRPLRADDEHQVTTSPSSDDDLTRIPARPPWYQEWLRLVAGIVVILAVGALLAATLGGHLFGNRP